MARVTVEDCLDNLNNRFELTLLAAKRARQLSEGFPPLVDADKDKPTVIALREISAGLITHEILDGLELSSSMTDETEKPISY